MATEKNQTLAVKWRISLAVKPSTHWDLQLLGKSCGQATGRKPVTALEDILKLSFTFPIMLFSFAAKWLGCRRAGEFNVWGQFSTGGFLHMWSTSRDLVFSETYGQNANLIPYYTQLLIGKLHTSATAQRPVCILSHLYWTATYSQPTQMKVRITFQAKLNLLNLP